MVNFTSEVYIASFDGKKNWNINLQLSQTFLFSFAIIGNILKLTQVPFPFQHFSKYIRKIIRKSCKSLILLLSDSHIFKTGFLSEAAHSFLEKKKIPVPCVLNSNLGRNHGIN